MIEPTGRRRVIDDGACSTAQAAEALGVSRRRVQTLIKQRRLDGFRPEGGRDWRITRESVERYRRERDEHVVKLKGKTQDDDNPDLEFGTSRVREPSGSPPTKFQSNRREIFFTQIVSIRVKDKFKPAKGGGGR